MGKVKARQRTQDKENLSPVGGAKKHATRSAACIAWQAGQGGDVPTVFVYRKVGGVDGGGVHLKRGRWAASRGWWRGTGGCGSQGKLCIGSLRLSDACWPRVWGAAAPGAGGQGQCRRHPSHERTALAVSPLPPRSAAQYLSMVRLVCGDGGDDTAEF